MSDAVEGEPDVVVRRGLVPGGCAAFVEDQDSPFKALAGGQGSGKTDAAMANALIVGSVNAPLPFLFVEPSHDLIRTVALATARRVLDAVEVNHVWHERDKVLVVGEGAGRFPIMMRSGEEPERIVGFEAGAGHVDEAALQKEAVWKAVVRRCRAPGARRKRISMTSSPEGLNWFYRVTKAKPAAGMRLYHARTADNPHMAPSVLRNMKATMTAAEYEAYAEGKFVNLLTGLVYSSFSRDRHDRRCGNPLAGQVVVGCDFNVGKMHWIVGRRLFDEIHIWGEVVGKNTNTFRQREALLRYLLEARASLPGPRDDTFDGMRRWLAQVSVYTDATGQARKTSATESDVEILRKSGMSVFAASSNPPIKDRFYSVEQLLRGGETGRVRLYVDCARCPELTRSLEGQGWGTDGLPEKGKGDDDLSGGPDALGYLCWGLGADFQAIYPGGNRILWQQYG